MAVLYVAPASCSHRVCVAENSPVLRCLGSRAKIEFSVPAKPMSRSVSASSSTRASSSDRRETAGVDHFSQEVFGISLGTRQSFFLPDALTV